MISQLLIYCTTAKKGKLIGNNIIYATTTIIYATTIYTAHDIIDIMCTYVCI